MSAPSASLRTRLLALGKRWAPYLIAGLALALVLHRTDYNALWSALRHAPVIPFVVMSLVLLLLNLAADTFAMNSVFGWFGFRVPYRDLLIVRASTYLVAIFNYHVGQAAIVGYLYRAHKVPIFRATGCILFIIGINVGTLFLLASAGASNASGELAWLRLVPIICAVGVVTYGALLLVKPAPLARVQLFAPLFEMGIVGHIKGVLVRLPHIGVLLLWHYLSLHMFGIQVSPTTALLYLPVYFAISSLPISPSGLGMPQVVAPAFFAAYATVEPGTVNPAAAQKSIVIAYSLATSGISVINQLLIGFLFLRRGVALGMPQSEAEASAVAQAEAQDKTPANHAATPY